MTEAPTNPRDEMVDLANYKELDVRIVAALAGDRDLNAREQTVVERLKEERGESLFSDMLYTLTHKMFPSRQAKTLWAEIGTHRGKLSERLGRDPGVAVATHDYLTNVSPLLKSVGLIEESKLHSITDVATRDGLTGLFDKTTFNHHLREELERQQRYGGALTLVMCDIDHFKLLNDTHGHADGDIALQQVAEIIAEQCRSTDIPGRIGGEEFGIILTAVDAKAGYIFAERLRQTIELKFVDSAYDVTISVGMAEATEENKSLTPDQLIRTADAALYSAKNNGRNQVLPKP